MQALRRTELKALARSIELGPLGTLKLIERKGVVGRGGAAYPVSRKWSCAINKKSDEKYVICNADEGEPGTFKDRLLLCDNPHTVIEGMLIAATVVSAKKGFLYLRGEYHFLKIKVEAVIRQVIADSGINIEIEIVEGAGSYVCGEETALIQSIQGFRAQPFGKPPFPPNSGLWGKPTIIDNVETFSAVAQAIFFDDWDNRLKLFSVSGDVDVPGVYEYSTDAGLTQLMESASPRQSVKAIYFGCSGGCMPPVDTELSRKKLQMWGCRSGTGAIIVIGSIRSIPSIARIVAGFFAYESCGKCTPCREGTMRLLHLLCRIVSNGGSVSDIEELQDLANHVQDTSLCGLGQSCGFHILTALRYFREEFIR